jgi:hypothetical protein
VAALVGCGGASSSTSSSTTAKGTSATTTATTAKQPKPESEAKGSTDSAPAKRLPSSPPASAFEPKPHHDSGGGSAQFIQKGGDNSVQNYGQEASETELKQAAASLHGFLDARVQGNWAAACTYLSKGAREGFAQVASQAPQLKGADCATVLAVLSEGLPASNLREAAIANVGSLRTEGDHGFLIYRGAKGFVYGISIAREGDAWRLQTPGGTPIAN